MTIRVPRQVQTVDTQRLASVITAAVINPPREDSADPTRTPKTGSNWVLWSGSSHSKPQPRLD